MILTDLHTHSTASDGTLSPAELVKLAAVSGISVLALTDHDTLSGCAEAGREAAVQNITFIPGVEISAKGNSHLHILGLGVDIENSELNQVLSSFAEERKTAAMKICEELKKFDVSVDYDEVLRCAGNGSVGKPHIAEIMVQKGYVSSVAEAFDIYLNHPVIKAVKKTKPDSEEVIRLIHKAGGFAVLAHPYQLKYERQVLHDFVGSLAESGLDGIECWYTYYTEDMMQEYTALAKEFGLMTTVGSDFHGDVKPGILPGTGRNGSILNLLKIKSFDGEILKKLNI